jgi:hypothetical protein
MKIEKVALTELKQYRNNPRKGNVSLIADSLEAYGQYKPITVNANTKEILAGNHTYQAARSLGWSEIDVVFVDVDETTAAKIVAIDNRSSDMGEYDKKVLADLLDSINDLSGTGYTTDEFDDLLAEIQELELPQLSAETRTYMPELEVGETGQNNTRFTTSLADYAERYAQKATRMLMCDYQNDTYVWLIEKLGQYRTTTGINNNADAIIRLIEDALGEKCPHETI